MTNQRKKKVIDSIWGFAIGDALGVPYEFSKSNNLKNLQMVGHMIHDQPAGTWSDDTSFLLACLDSEQNINSLWNNYRDILEGKYSIDGKLFDIGAGTAENLKKEVKNLIYLQQGDDESKGNGCLSRAIPYAALDGTFVLRMEDTCLTHCNKISSSSTSELVDYYQDLYDGLEVRTIPNIIWEGLPTSGYVEHSLRISLGIGLSCTSFDDGILKCINLGGDTDSHAAIVGSIAAIRFGLPVKWLKELRGREMIQRIIDKSVWLK